MYIGIAGNIGVGKTTLAEKLASRLNYKFIEESVVDNPYLDDFYKDENRWAFETQIFFVRDRLEKLPSNLSYPDIVLDRTIYEDKNIFAKNLLNKGSLDQRAYNTYSAWYDFATKDIRSPDLLVYLKADVSKLKQNIVKRGRDYEKKLTLPNNEYVAHLNKLYDSWIDSYDLGKLLVIDFNKLDIVENKKDENIVIDKILMKLYSYFTN